MPKLSVTVITRNEEANLAAALESVSWADEIVVVDAESTDRTVEIASRFTKNVVVRRWNGYVEQKNYAAEAASGEGSRLYGGRWNSRGVRIVYASTSLALAAIETFVNLEPNQAPDDLVFIEGVIPDAVDIGRLDVSSLSAGWRKSRDESLHRFGDEWVSASPRVALLVPSAAIRGEWNVLLNPISCGVLENQIPKTGAV